MPTSEERMLALFLFVDNSFDIVRHQHSVKSSADILKRVLALFLFVYRSSDIVRHPCAVKSVGTQGWAPMLFLFADRFRRGRRPRRPEESVQDWSCPMGVQEPSPSRYAANPQSSFHSLRGTPAARHLSRGERRIKALPLGELRRQPVL